MSIPLTGDQKVYISIALEMFEKKQWIIPSLFNEPNFLKPPLQYWATIVGWKVFGISVFGALISSVLALVGSAFFTFKIGTILKLKNPEIAALLFASSLGSMTYGSTAQMEVWIVFFFLASWWAVLESRITLAFMMVGIMAWVKGPLYPVLFTMSLLVWDLKLVKIKKFWLSIIFGVIVGLSWYFLAAQTNQKEMLNQFLYSENIGKISTVHGSIMGLWGEFLFSLFPWLGVIIVGCFQNQTRDAWKKNQKFYLSYTLLSAIFFTVFPYRVNSYLYFLTPIMAMLASEVDLEINSKIKKINLLLYSIFYSLIFIILVRLYLGQWIGIEIVIGILLSFFVFLMGFVRGKIKFVALSSLLIVNLFRVSAVEIGENDFAGLRDFAAKNTSELAFYIESKDIWHEFGLVSAAIGKSVQRLYRKQDLVSFLALGGSVIVQDEQEILFEKNVRCVDWNRLKRRTKFPIQKLLIEGVMWGDPAITRVYRICTASQ